MASARLPIALHIPQDLLPLSGVGSQTNGSSTQPVSKSIGSGSGYGPPMAPEGTPLSRLVSNTLYTPSTEPTPAEAAAGWTGNAGVTEYDLVCLPLTNSSWQERWERMCTISTSGTMMDLSASTATSPVQGSEEWTKREAETWRAGGGFARGEVNVTRSGKSLLPRIESKQQFTYNHST